MPKFDKEDTKLGFRFERDFGERGISRFAIRIKSGKIGAGKVA